MSIALDDEGHKYEYMTTKLLECKKSTKYYISKVYLSAHVSMNFFQFVDVSYSIKNIINAYSRKWLPIDNDANISISSGP
ncbi:hypothetical protein CR513_41466, partial [Mucuna pruriens]